MAFLLFCVAKVSSQSIPSWKTDTRKYVQDQAILAAADQIAVQEKLKELETTNKHIQDNLKSVSEKNEKSILSAQLISNKTKLTATKSDLKKKIAKSKMFKKILTLEDDKLLQALVKQKVISIDESKVNPKSDISHVELKNPTTDTEPAGEEKKDIKNSESAADIAYQKNKLPETIEKNDCNFQVVADKKKTALEPEILFTYTPEELKKHLKGIPYSKGWAFVAREPGYLLLQLNMEIASEQALDYYGNLSKSFMTIKLVNGKEVRLINSGFDSGKIDRYKKASIISGIFNIDKPSEKTLLSSEVDTIKLNLISGFEIYTIYNVDFFTRQLSCINSLK